MDLNPSDVAARSGGPGYTYARVNRLCDWCRHRRENGGVTKLTDAKSAAEGQPNSIDPSGLGVGFGLAVFGTLILLFPSVVSVDEAWQTFIFMAAVTVTVIGVGGVFFELAKHRARPWLSDIGTACVVLGLASAFLILQVRTEFPYVVDLLTALVMFTLLAIGVVGLGMGLSKASHTRPVSVPNGRNEADEPAHRSDRLGRNDKLNIVVAILCTLVQCVVSVLIALTAATPPG